MQMVYITHDRRWLRRLDVNMGCIIEFINVYIRGENENRESFHGYWPPARTLIKLFFQRKKKKFEKNFPNFVFLNFARGEKRTLQIHF